ncbi:Myosin phosphatase Rho-interacting protein [Acipenser ruthenus]|uniref:Myosin phosphatase Rho-interacting protein n=1 Tax=Acipenser ruthenus TaxID=7906 RepID=A0A444UCA0_ACIRT|nr:Myosin phosphatase Rho-interacting protein [Acipenser ruthenus]
MALIDNFTDPQCTARSLVKLAFHVGLWEIHLKMDRKQLKRMKWQRRFFILYEHGLLRYALDEMPSTLPQGTINMNQCSDVIDGESRTGQRSSLCILVPDKEYFIRAENKEIINGWRETLIVYPRSNKQSQKKKRKVEPPTPQEPGPAKVAVTSSSSVPDIHAVDQVPTSKSTLWQEELRGRSTIPCSRSASCLYQLSQPSGPQGAPTGTPKEDHRRVSGDHAGGGRKARVESGYFSLEKIKPESRPPPPQQLQITSPTRYSYPDVDALTPCRSPEYCDPFLSSHSPSPFSSSQSSLDSEASSSTQTSGASWEARSHPARNMREYASLADIPKAKRISNRDAFQPDLLNFKKGWMTKLYEDNQWKKHWFVLTDQSLRYYRDSIAEEAADLDGEIDLSTCHDVTEFPVQRNYGFQIHTKEGAFTLSAMTSGIRRNWIQAIMKNARPTTAPDVTSSLPEEAKVHSTYGSASASGEIQESEVDGGSTEQRRSRARERRREGRSKTFDWAEFRPMQQAMAQKASSPSSSDSAQISEAASQDPGNMTDLERERAQRREERRKRFESVTAAEEATRMEVDRAPASPETKPVQVEIEQRWHKVETMPLREEKQIPITTLHSTVPVAEPLPPQELAALLDKEATCERGFAAMEETHQKVLEDIQRQHQREVGKLREEKDRLLAEETAATIADNDTDNMRLKGNDTDNMGLKDNDTDNMRLKDNDTDNMRLKGNDTDNMGLKDNDTDNMRFKDNDTDNMRLKGNDTDNMRLKDNDTDNMRLKDIMKSKSNPDFLKKERSSISRQIRSMRSKSLKEGLSVQERLKLFEARDSKKI